VRAIRSLLDRFTAPRLSRWLIGISTVLLTGWLQSHLLLAAIHDDGATVRNAVTVYNSPEVRAQLTGATDWVFDQGAALSGGGAQLAPVQAALQGALASGRIPDAAADALVASLVRLRDDALVQFAADAPARPLELELGPLLTSFGITVTPELLTAMGLPATAELAVPILDAGSVDTLRTRYHWAVLLDRWGLPIGALAGVVGIVLARRPLRALSVALMIGGVVCLAAIPLFGVIGDWLVGGGAGPWSPLVAPLVTAGIDQVRPWLLPLAIAGIVAGGALLTLLLVRERRVSTAQGGSGQDERATRPSTPWTNEPDSSVENSLASSTASSIATAGGTSSL